MQLVGAGNQNKFHPLFCADGALASGGAAQLALPAVPQRSFLQLQNLSSGSLWFEFGSARATATLSGGGVASIAVTNAGFGFTYAPSVYFFGGGYGGNASYLGLGQPGGEAPDSRSGPGRVAQAHCVLSSGSVGSIVVDDPGVGYVTAPYVFIHNSPLDPNGCAIPSATSGMLLIANSGPYILNGTSCATDAIAVYGATTGQLFLCRWMT